MMKTLVTRKKHLTTLVLVTLLTVPASFVFAEEIHTYWGNGKENNDDGHIVNVDEYFDEDVEYELDNYVPVPGFPRLDIPAGYRGLEVVAPNNHPVTVTMEKKYTTKISNAVRYDDWTTNFGAKIYGEDNQSVTLNVKGDFSATVNSIWRSYGLDVGNMAVVRLNGDNNKFDIDGFGFEVIGIHASGHGQDSSRDKLYVSGNTIVEVDNHGLDIHHNASEYAQGIYDEAAGNTFFGGTVTTIVSGASSTSNIDGIKHTGNNTLTFNKNVTVTVGLLTDGTGDPNRQTISGVNLVSSNDMTTNFKSALNITASGEDNSTVYGIYSKSTGGIQTNAFGESGGELYIKASGTANQNVYGIYSEGTAGTHESTFKDKVTIDSTGEGIHHEYGALNFDGNTDADDVTITSGTSGVSLSSNQADKAVSTTFNKALTINAGAGSTDTANVYGIHSTGTDGTQESNFNGNVNVTSTGEGIHHEYGALNFDGNTDEDDVTITAGTSGVSLSSNQADKAVSTNFNKALTINAGAGSTDTANVYGIHSTGTDGTQESNFNGNVNVTSTGEGIHHEYGALNFDGNTDEDDVTITAGTSGVSLSSNQAGKAVNTTFNKALMINAGAGSTDTANVYGIHSTGTDGTQESNFNGNVNVTSTGEGIHHEYGALNFDGNTDEDDVTITAGTSGLNISSNQADKVVSTTFNKALTINAGRGSTDTANIYGIHSTGTDGTQQSIFNNAVKIDSDGKGIRNEYGALNFKENTNITMGTSGIEAIGQGRTINFDKGLIITPKSGNLPTAVYTADGGSININNTKKDNDVLIIGKIEAVGGTITANLTKRGSFIKGDVIANSSGTATITSKDSIIDGNLSSKDTGTVTVTMDGISTLTGKSSLDEINPGIVNVTLKNGSTWNVTDTSTLSTLNLDANSIVNLSKQSGCQLMTISTLISDGGTFVLGSDVNQNVDNDKIVITDNFIGTAKLSLVDMTGSGILKEEAFNTVLVATKGDGKFLAAAAVETPLYWFDYKLDSDYNTGTGYQDWFTNGPGVKSSEQTTTVDTITSSAIGSYYAWRTDNDKLMQRLGDLRQSKNEDQGIWARVTRNGTEYDHNAYFHNNTSTVQVGYDKVISRDTKDNYWVAGGAIGYLNGSSSYHHGSGDNSATTFNLYGTRMGSKGHYLDLVAKVGKYNHHFDSYMMNGFQQKGDYDTFGYSVSAEYGRKTPLKSGWYVEPQMQLTFGHLNSVDYVTSNGIKVDQDGINSAIGRVGFNIGRNVGQKANFYLKANLSHEFGGRGHVSMSTSQQNRNEELSLDDTWFTYGMGVSAPMSKDSYMYFDIERSTGSDFTTDWQWNAGMRFSI